METFVRPCDACQPVGEPQDQKEARIILVPLITKPFQRLVVGIVGPLRVTKSGHRYILTMFCPATKLPEAVPLKELSLTAIMEAPFTVFTRIGFPVEIQSDPGSVFTSALSVSFFEKCGIRSLHSCVYHPQSNSV